MRTIEFCCEQCGLRCKKPRRTDSDAYFCSVQCSTRWRRLHPVLPWVCTHCRARFGGSRRFETRQFCSRECWRLRRAIEGAAQSDASADRRQRNSKSYNREWYRANRDKKDRQGVTWKAANKAKVAKYARDHRRKFPDRFIARRNGLTEIEWISIKTEYEHMCLCCRRREPDIKLEPDHVVPIARGGCNLASNIQPLCRSCNARKHARTIDYRP